MVLLWYVKPDHYMVIINFNITHRLATNRNQQAPTISDRERLHWNPFPWYLKMG